MFCHSDGTARGLTRFGRLVPIFMFYEMFVISK